MCWQTSADANCGPDKKSCEFYNHTRSFPLSPQIQVYSLETRQLEITVGNSAGDFTCVNLRDSPPHLLVCGNKDRRYDTTCVPNLSLLRSHMHTFLSSVWHTETSCDCKFLKQREFDI